MITKGSKIKLVKEMGEFKNIGEVCEVIKITEDGVVSFRFGNNGCHLGCMSYNEYEKYFEPYTEPIKKKCKWSDWEHIIVDFHDIFDKRIIKYLNYRTNGVKIQLRCDGLKARSSCYKTDKFDIECGLDLAKRRWIVKYLDRQVKNIASQM
jgi:hypothetical protein